MKILLDANVLEQARARMRWLFDEFPVVVVGYSGGKDSTIVLELALEVARERKRTPLPVLFLDQEAEWTQTVEMVREVMARPDVEPHWLQFPIRLSNGTSEKADWLMCWEEGGEWLRDKEPGSIHVNNTGTMTFASVFGAYMAVTWPGVKACYVAGMRADESRSRAMALTFAPKYKWVPWANNIGGRKNPHYTFYPIYDWSIHDVWKAIFQHGWKYNELYDKMYQLGLPLNEMRVSNVHHETAVRSLFFMQEVDRPTWEKLTKRLSGINTAKHLSDDLFGPTKLPYMFRDWTDYRDHLLKNLIQDPDKQAKFRAEFRRMDALYAHPAIRMASARAGVSALLVNDHHGTKVHNFSTHPDVGAYRQWRQGRRSLDHGSVARNPYVLDALKYDRENPGAIPPITIKTKDTNPDE